MSTLLLLSLHRPVRAVPGGALVCHMVPVALCNALIFLPGSPVFGYPASCSLSSLLSSIYCPFPGAALPSVTSHACLSVCRGIFAFLPLCHIPVSDPAASWLTRLQMQGHAVRQRGCQFRTSPTGSEHSGFVCQHPQIISICCLKSIKERSYSLCRQWFALWVTTEAKFRIILNIFISILVPKLGCSNSFWVWSLMRQYQHFEEMDVSDCAALYSHSSKLAESTQGKRGRILLKDLLRGK